ncbi:MULTISPECIES: fumarylacetoacetate hydrolase family protein [Microbacterium]|jgi:acylpyruvate hydrolase|uniref:fumarylacetoacetate hydrolase family protein n=1 Tax=Microbacterium TaxID=33882 RepID=UPI001D1740F0|nr:fumarylacetoacetate hydrolase family protein [Microbacterium testaceum]MCC4250354.1 fumarylacetoacetate hydrolase family protein [Microbacterium testaceum]
MPYISYLFEGAAHVGEVVGDGVVPLDGLSEIGRDTAGDTLASAPRDTRRTVPLNEVDLLPVVPHAGKVFCVGLNYLSHVDETKRDLPDYPVLFPKFGSSFIAAGTPIPLPPESGQVDYEAELAVVIGTSGRRIAEADALAHVMGYTIANDVTMRDFQYKTHQWLPGKAWDVSTPLGPALFLPHEVDLEGARISLTLNGERLQDSDLSRLIFSVPFLISTISTFTTLEPGDVILTGTPGGVGYRREPQVFLRPGDRVEVSIAGLGTLANPVEEERTLP